MSFVFFILFFSTYSPYLLLDFDFLMIFCLVFLAVFVSGTANSTQVPRMISINNFILSDKNEGLLLQTLPRTQRVPFNTLGSSRPLSSAKLFEFTIFKIFGFTNIIWTIIMFNHIPSPNWNVRHFL